MEKQDLDKYVQKVLEIQQQQKKDLSQKELKSVALSIGLSESDWQAVEKELSDSLIRGEGFLKYQNWADAIEEFQSCQTIRPMHLESLFGLTKAYFNQWKELGNEKDKLAAVKHGEDYLNIQPSSDEVLMMVSELKKRNITPNQNLSNKKRRRLLVTAIGVFLLVIGVFMMFFLTFNAGYTEDPPVPPEVSTPAVIMPQEEVSNEVEENTTVETNDNEGDELNREILVSFRNKSNTDFEWELFSSPWEKFYNNATNWGIKGFIQSPSKNTIRLFLKLKGFDKEGAEVFNNTVEIVDEDKDMIRKGDIFPFGFESYDEKGVDISSVEITIESVKQEDFLGSYNASPSIDFSWDIPQPNNINFEIRERFVDYGTESFGLRFYKHQLEVKNIGNLSVKHLKLRHRWFLEGEQEPFKIEEEYIVSSGKPVLQVGKTFVESGTYQLEKVGNTKVKRTIAIAAVEY